MAHTMDRDTRRFLEGNSALGEASGAHINDSLKDLTVYVDMTLPRACYSNGESLTQQAIPISINFAEIAKTIFPDEPPEVAFVKSIKVERASLRNGEGTKLSLSAGNGLCGRAMSSDTHTTVGEPICDGGTFLVLSDGSDVSGLEGVYDATSFAAPGALFAKYPGALKSDINDNISYVNGSPTALYKSIYNDSQLKVDGDAVPAAGATQDTSPVECDWFLCMVHKNLERLKAPPVLTKKAGDGVKYNYIYTLDINNDDIAELLRSAQEQIYAPLRKHVISLKEDTGVDTCFHITARSEAHENADQEVQMWPHETDFKATLAVTLSYFVDGA